MQSREVAEQGSKTCAMWAAVAPSWAEYAEYADARGYETGRIMLDAVALCPGERVLELACGPGGLGMSAAAEVGARGEVVLSDGVQEMVDIAAARALAAGLKNVATRVVDLDAIVEPDASYNVVLCREGLMFATDVPETLGEIRRILRPGGRVALAVWSSREKNPWLGIVLDVLSAQLGRPVPPPGFKGPFALSDIGAFSALLSGAGFSGLTVKEHPVPQRNASFDEWWARTCALAGPVSQLLASMPEQAAQTLRSRARDATRAFQTPAGLDFPGVSIIASGRRA